MKLFNAVLLAGLFAAVAAQVEPEVDALNIYNKHVFTIQGGGSGN